MCMKQVQAVTYMSKCTKLHHSTTWATCVFVSVYDILPAEAAGCRSLSASPSTQTSPLLSSLLALNNNEMSSCADTNSVLLCFHFHDSNLNLVWMLSVTWHCWFPDDNGQITVFCSNFSRFFQINISSTWRSDSLASVCFFLITLSGIIIVVNQVWLQLCLNFYV